MIHKKLLSLLVLLMTAASGAWAEEVTIGDPTSTSTNSHLPSYSLEEYNITQQIYTADEIGMSGTITTLTMWLKNTSTYARNFDVYMKEVSGSFFEDGDSWVSLSADDLVGTATINNGVRDPTETTFTLETPFEYSGTGNLLICIHDITGNWSSGVGGVFFDTESNQALYVSRDDSDYDISNPGVTGSLTNKKNVVRLDIEKSGLEVTTNKAEGETTFTEAWFTMPTFDATVNYELVRDMEIAVNAVMPASIRLQKKQQGGGYEPIDDTKMIPEVKDAIDGESQAVTMTEVTEQTAETGDYTLKLQKLGDGETWVDANPNDLSVGTYRYEVTGANLYDGVCYTNEFKLFEGYPVTIPAGEYVTYYSDENLTVDAESGAQLYTITAVSGNIAIATEIPIANAGMPFLIFNSTDEPQTFMLIPTENEINQTFAREFVGTTTATTIAASTTEQSNYAFNGKQFVIVRTALSVAANKAWLEVKNTNARAINIVLDEMTGVNEVNEVNEVSDDTLYDLNGRKVQKPARKGVYVKNGQKVIR